ncbi:hypothetical protein DICA0_F22276 [Diutina catenulata]
MASLYGNTNMPSHGESKPWVTTEDAKVPHLGTTSYFANPSQRCRGLATLGQGLTASLISGALHRSCAGGKIPHVSNDAKFSTAARKRNPGTEHQDATVAKTRCVTSVGCGGTAKSQLLAPRQAGSAAPGINVGSMSDQFSGVSHSHVLRGDGASTDRMGTSGP